MTTFGTGEGYRCRLARVLFGSPETERLDSLAQLLRVLRTPNLGAKLNLPCLTDRLRMALPPLTDHEVNVLAEGWDELDQLAHDRDTIRAARDAVDAFRARTWQPWVSMLIRRYADALASAVTEFDNVTRAQNAAKDTLETATAAHAELEAKHGRLKEQLQQARVDEQAWRESDTFKSAAASQARLRETDGGSLVLRRSGAELARYALGARAVEDRRGAEEAEGY